MVTRTLQLQFLALIITGLLIVSFFIVKPFLSTLILAGIFAIILYPLHTKTLPVTKHRKGLSSFITVSGSAICLVVPLLILSTQLFKEVVSLYTSSTQGTSSHLLFSTALHSLGTLFERFIPGTGTFFSNLSQNLDTYIQQGLAWLVQHLGIALSEISILLVQGFIFFIALYYFLKEWESLRNALITYSPLSEKETLRVLTNISNAVNSIIKGSLLIALLQGTLTGIGFLVFGVPNAILWGVVAMLTSLVPGIGTGLVLVPGIIYLFITSSTASVLGLTIWGVVIVGLVDNIIRPLVVGGALEIHPLLILLSVIGGLIFFGPLGLFLGPIILSILLVVITLYKEIAHHNA